MPLHTSYLPNYFSVDDIMATQEKTMCKMLVNIPNLATKLNSGAEENDIKAGSSIELPIWLVNELTKSVNPYVAVEVPKIYKPAYREVLRADATAVDLRKFGLYFYDLGCHIAQFDSRRDVTNTLVHTFQSRFLQLMDLAENEVTEPTAVDKLDTLERKLFKDGIRAKNDINAWLNISEIPLEAASLVVNHRKRKKMDN